MSTNHTNWFPALSTTSNSSIGEGIRQYLQKQWLVHASEVQRTRTRSKFSIVPESHQFSHLEAHQDPSDSCGGIMPQSFQAVDPLGTLLALSLGALLKSHSESHRQSLQIFQLWFLGFIQVLKWWMAFVPSSGSTAQVFHPLGHLLDHQQGFLRFALLQDLQTFQHRPLVILQAFWLLHCWCDWIPAARTQG